VDSRAIKLSSRVGKRSLTLIFKWSNMILLMIGQFNRVPKANVKLVQIITQSFSLQPGREQSKAALVSMFSTLT
jgi:hypothetical protein